MSHRPRPASESVIRGGEGGPPTPPAAHPLVGVHATVTGCILYERGDFGDIVWVVEESHCADVPGARAERCLVFVARHAFRRVYDFPPHWRTLSAAQLLAVSWRR